MNHPEFLEFGMIHEEIPYYPCVSVLWASASIIF